MPGLFEKDGVFHSVFKVVNTCLDFLRRMVYSTVSLRW